MKNIKKDLSITRIAGLTWNEWNARLAMPLVTQLREGVHPLIFPTDLSINHAIDKQNAVAAAAAAAGNGGTTALPLTTKTTSNTSGVEAIELDAEPKSPPMPVTPPNELNDDGSGVALPTSSTPLNCSNANTTSAEKRSSGKLKRLTEEEARSLMLKAAAEKTAAGGGYNNSGNLSDNSYGADTKGNISTAGGGESGGDANDFHTALSNAGAFADTGLFNSNILNSISAMNSLIGGGGGSSGAAGNNSGLILGSNSGSLSLTVAGSGGGIGGSGGGAGHPCPECGRVYKLKSSLRNHQKWECGKEPQFQCPFCVYRAKQKMHIGRHMERMHKEKFTKLEDFKSYTGGSDGDESGAATAAAVAAAAAAAANALVSADLRQHFA